MRELTLIGLDVDGKHVICEGGDPADKFLIRVDDRLRAAMRAACRDAVAALRPQQVAEDFDHILQSLAHPGGTHVAAAATP